MFDRIQEAVSTTGLAHHVVRPYFAVENQLGDNDKEVSRGIRMIVCLFVIAMFSTKLQLYLSTQLKTNAGWHKQLFIQI